MGQQLQAHHEEHCKRYDVVTLLFHAVWVMVNLHNSPYLRVQISEAREESRNNIFQTSCCTYRLTPVFFKGID